jgi:hypothetical protein
MHSVWLVFYVTDHNAHLLSHGDTRRDARPALSRSASSLHHEGKGGDLTNAETLQKVCCQFVDEGFTSRQVIRACRQLM